MADINLTQTDADVLLAMEKHKVDDTPYQYPSLGGGVRIPLQSLDKRESFFLDITRSQIVLTKGTYQNRRPRCRDPRAAGLRWCASPQSR